MSTVSSFEDLQIWKLARSLSNEVGNFIEEGKFKKDYGLMDQINRSSGSIMDNIAEGFEREGTKEFIQFLGFAKGSCGEVRSQLYRALDRKYITDEHFKILYDQTYSIAKGIRGLMTYLKNSEYKGSKFKEPLESYGQKTQPDITDNQLLI